jgi:hypothetical protein
LWWSLPTRFEGPHRPVLLVRVPGLLSAAAGPLLATGSHDLAVRVGALLGLLAFATSVWAWPREGARRVRALGVLALSAVLANYLGWEARLCVRALPAIQEIALGAFLGWAVLVALEIARDPLRSVDDA